ncbi:hypothetical protein [Microbacterium maritypicum]
MSKKQDRKGHEATKAKAPSAMHEEFVRSGHRLSWMFGCSSVVALGFAMFFYANNPSLETAAVFIPSTTLLSASLATYIVAQRPLFRQSADTLSVTKDEIKTSSSQSMSDGTMLPTISELNSRVEKTPTGPTKIVS